MKQELMIRQVQPEDAALLRELARRCPPLDVHTHYTYWVIARYFGKNSFIAEQDGRGAAYITSVENNDTLLIWQIGITEALRGRGLSFELIDRVVTAARQAGKSVQVTIDRQNLPSNGAFRSYCRKKGYVLRRVGQLSLRDPLLPSFAEDEEIYEIAACDQKSSVGSDGCEV